MDLKRFAILFLCLIALIVYYYSKDRQKEIEKTIREIETGKVEESPQQLNSRFTEHKKLMTKSLDRLNQGEYLEASALFSKASYFFRDRENGEIGAWYKDFMLKYKDKVKEKTKEIISKFTQGDLSVADYKQLSNNYKHAGYSELSKYLKDNDNSISAERIKNARNWIRVNFQNYLKDFDKEIFPLLNKKNKEQNLKFVKGYYYSYQEDKATLKVLTVTVKQKEANYQIKQRSNNSYIAAPRIPYELELEFKIKNNKEIKTSWDNLSKIIRKVDIPKTIYLEDKKNNEGDRIKNEKIKELKLLVLEELAKMPEFEIFPDAKNNELHLISKRKFQKENFLIMYYKNPQKLKSEIKKIVNNGNYKSDLISMLIKFNLEEYSDYVTNNIYRLNDRELNLVIKEYKLNPYYGNFIPLLRLVEKTDSYPYQLLNSLKNAQQIPGMEEIVLKKIFKLKGSNRNNYAGFYIDYAKPESIKKSFSRLLNDKDEYFTKSCFNQLKNKYSDETDSYVLANYSKVSNDVKVLFWSRFRYDKNKHSKSSFALLKKEAANFKNDQLQKACINTLLTMKNSKEGWLAIYNTLPKYRNKIEKQRLEGQLVYAVKYAKPDVAEQFILHIITNSENNQLRGDAAHQLLDSDEDKSAAFKLLNQITKNNPKLLKRVINSILQFYKLRKNFDLSNDDLYEIVKRSGKTNDRYFNKRLEQFKEYARKRGEERYE